MVGRVFSLNSSVCAVVLSWLLMPTIANATLWEIDLVLTGAGVPGFGASLFHDATDGAPMSGSNIGTITGGPGVLGTYDDVSGAFNATFDLLDMGDTVTLTS